MGDKDEKDSNLCDRPVTTPEGITIPQCMDMITAEDVSRELSKYLEYYKEYDKSRYKRKPIMNAGKVGRNTKCPCGSGKKYKYCCGK